MSWVEITLLALGTIIVPLAGFALKVWYNDLGHIRHELGLLHAEIADLRQQFIDHLQDHGR